MEDFLNPLSICFKSPQKAFGKRVRRTNKKNLTISLSPLQLVDLFLFVVLLILRLPEDLQEPLHLGLGLPSILPVLGHFLLQAGYALREFSAGLGICCRALRLEQKISYYK